MDKVWWNVMKAQWELGKISTLMIIPNIQNANLGHSLLWQSHIPLFVLGPAKF